MNKHSWRHDVAFPVYVCFNSNLSYCVVTLLVKLYCSADIKNLNSLVKSQNKESLQKSLQKNRFFLLDTENEKELTLTRFGQSNYRVTIICVRLRYFQIIGNTIIEALQFDEIIQD